MIIFYKFGYWRRLRFIKKGVSPAEQSRFNFQEVYQLSKDSPYIESADSFREVVADKV